MGYAKLRRLYVSLSVDRVCTVVMEMDPWICELSSWFQTWHTAMSCLCINDVCSLLYCISMNCKIYDFPNIQIMYLKIHFCSILISIDFVKDWLYANMLVGVPQMISWADLTSNNPDSTDCTAVCNIVKEQVKFACLKSKQIQPSDPLSSAPGKHQSVSNLNNPCLPEAFALSHLFDLSMCLTSILLCHVFMYLYKVSLAPVLTMEYRFPTVISSGFYNE